MNENPVLDITFCHTFFFASRAEAFDLLSPVSDGKVVYYEDNSEDIGNTKPNLSNGVDRIAFVKVLHRFWYGLVWRSFISLKTDHFGL